MSLTMTRCGSTTTVEVAEDLAVGAKGVSMDFESDSEQSTHSGGSGHRRPSKNSELSDLPELKERGSSSRCRSRSRGYPVRVIEQTWSI
jgi:hypothetical protein